MVCEIRRIKTMAIIGDQDREFLKNKFSDELQEPMRIIAFIGKAKGQSSPGFECEFCEETYQLVSEVAELSDKISVETREYSPDDQMVKDMGIDKLPALVLANANSSGVRYYGIPGGFEFSSFIEDLVDVSANETNLSQEAKDAVHGIDRDVHIQVFVTPTCPYCPSAVRTAHQMAIENPRHIRADAVEAAEFPHLVARYDISAVPTVVINEKVQFEGALSEEDFTQQVTEAIAA
jgi:glutaredoxin-like protein